MIRNLLSDFDLTKEEVLEILDLAEDMKGTPDKYWEVLKGRTLIMLFELASLRTRISFEAAMTQMGGHAIFYSIAGGVFTRSETLVDGVKVLSRYSDCIMARVLSQGDIEKIGEAASVPVINGMTMKYHPCQNIGDLLTIKEKKGRFEGLKIAYVGDGGCNTANSTIIGCSNVGMNVTVVCPEGAKYTPNPAILERAIKRASGSIKVSHDPRDVEGADVIYTDTWISAGMDEEKEERMRIFPPFQVNSELVKRAKEDCIVMHCLPAYRGYEITDEVMDAPYSVVLDQAENRMHTEKAIIYWLMKQ